MVRAKIRVSVTEACMPIVRVLSLAGGQPAEAVRFSARKRKLSCRGRYMIDPGAERPTSTRTGAPDADWHAAYAFDSTATSYSGVLDNTEVAK